MQISAEKAVTQCQGDKAAFPGISAVKQQDIVFLKLYSLPAIIKPTGTVHPTLQHIPSVVPEAGTT